MRSLGGAARGERAAGERDGRRGDRKWDIIEGDKGARAGYQGVQRTYAEAKFGECTGFWGNQVSRIWRVLIDWKGAERVRVHNAHRLVDC